MISAYDFNLYIKGNCLKRPDFQVLLSGLYIPVPLSGLYIQVPLSGLYIQVPLSDLYIHV